MKTPKINGWLILDKPLEITSAGAIRRIKKLFPGQKIGHGGTLDPLASGVLPLAFGEATKLMSYVFDGSKTYEFTVKWGAERSTDDLEGEVVASNDHRPTFKEVKTALPFFIGTIEQTPPTYSAIKIQGKRACDLARQGQNIELIPRPIQIDSIEILNHTTTETLFRVSCGKGTYVRSLARDIGRRIGCLGHVTTLRRTHVGAFKIDDSVNFEKLLEIHEQSELLKNIKRFDEVLDDIPAATLSKLESDALRQGQFVPRQSGILFKEGITFLCRNWDKTPIALAYWKDGFLRPKRVFHLDT